MSQWTNTTTYISQLNTQLPLHGQVQFPATQVPSADANCLDDYEEGTWTPAIGGTATYTVQTGRYTKVGRLVGYTGQLTINVVGTGAVGTISGLPFTAGSIAAVHFGFFATSATSYVWVTGYISSGAASITMHALAAAGTSTSAATFFANSTNTAFGGSFTV